jgi:hypothetical protein
MRALFTPINWKARPKADLSGTHTARAETAPLLGAPSAHEFSHRPSLPANPSTCSYRNAGLRAPSPIPNGFCRMAVRLRDSIASGGPNVFARGLSRTKARKARAHILKPRGETAARARYRSYQLELPRNMQELPSQSTLPGRMMA